MGNTVTVVKGDLTEVFEDVLGHQVGYSNIQVLERSGNQRIISNFDDITISLDEVAAANFERELFDQENPPGEPQVVEVPDVVQDEVPEEASH